MRDPAPAKPGLAGARCVSGPVRGGSTPDGAGSGFRPGPLWDPAGPLPDHRRVRAKEYAQRQVDAVRRTIFPVPKL